VSYFTIQGANDGDVSSFDAAASSITFVTPSLDLGSNPNSTFIEPITASSIQFGGGPTPVSRSAGF